MIMAKNKLRKFAEFEAFDNTFSADEGILNKGKWNKNYFKNNNPIVLELACGKGEYTVNLAKLFPEKNFIGIDRKGDRLWRGAKTAIEQNLSNVGFLRIRIEDLNEYFSEQEVSEIWITFPDPQPSQRREKKRLTYIRFLNLYKDILLKEGVMHLKTDNDLLYESSLEQLKDFGAEVIEQTSDLYKSDLVDDVLSIKTYYEKKYLAEDKNINYIKWSFNEEE